tara:strand:- start:607 stop:804 length:198 start_codon:yes stop_codon:yes gene_type:complete
METIIFLCTILGAYIFGVISGVIMMRTSVRDAKHFRQELLNSQTEQLKRTRKNKVDASKEPYLTL